MLDEYLVYSMYLKNTCLWELMVKLLFNNFCLCLLLVIVSPSSIVEPIEIVRCRVPGSISGLQDALNALIFISVTIDV